MQSAKTTYPQFKTLDYPKLEAEIARFWEEENIFEQSLERRREAERFTFFEGPPSANGKPGVHHVLSRALKDIFCRYKSLKGYYVARKAGWDTHGLPVELQVEKAMGITKKDVGEKISIEEYNAACARDVLKFKDVWDDLTRKMGYWINLDDPYVTFTNEYVESVWNLLKRLFDKGLLYKGYTIQPYSPAAGTGLSSHELNLPGCYKSVKDTSCVAQFKVKDAENEYFLAWTTTPWTLPSNTALAVGKNIIYNKVETFNPYTHEKVFVYLAKELVSRYFSAEQAELSLDDYKPGDKQIPYRVAGEIKGSELAGMRYEQLMPYLQPEGGDPFRVIVGDFVTTEEGTGIVHLAPTFGADDLRVAREQNIPPLTVKDAEGNETPLVDKQGKFVAEVTDFAGRYVKNYEEDPDYVSVDIDICVLLKKANRAFKVEKYEHNYPHCWRTDKPVLYYPLDSWFIRTSEYRERLVELNKTINWKPENTGTGRFGKWLENLVDWNLSRSRFWGTPLPVWRNEAGTETVCIGSMEELSQKIDEAVAAGVMSENPVKDNPNLDLHRPYVDRIILADSEGKPMQREIDLIDVWFDSGAMPFAQWHYPFENQEVFQRNFPADFIAEGIDQTRGWFFTLHAIAVMLEDSVAFKNVIANGLVLDKDGNKMSKRLGNAVDPFETIDTYGADATRWYMMENAQPWDNLKFNLETIGEVQRKFFGTLFNTYAFFALYANIDGYAPGSAAPVPLAERPELDRWIISKLNSLVKSADAHYADYDPTRAARAVQEFAIEELSNWYVRLARRRFWKGEMTADKRSAFQTLEECLLKIAQLACPIAPFFADWLYKNLSAGSASARPSVHLTDFPIADDQAIDPELEARMDLAQQVCSLARSIRRRVDLKIRQPLSKLFVPVLNAETEARVNAVADLVKSEINVKEIELVSADSGVAVKKIKPNFRALGPKLGKNMKAASKAINELEQTDISRLESEGKLALDLGGEPFELTLEDAEILTEDMPGRAAASNGKITIALDISLTDELLREGRAREFVNRIQNMRKEQDFDVTDQIDVQIEARDEWKDMLAVHESYIAAETLARSIKLVDSLAEGKTQDFDGTETRILINR